MFIYKKKSFRFENKDGKGVKSTVAALMKLQLGLESGLNN